MFRFRRRKLHDVNGAQPARHTNSKLVFNDEFVMFKELLIAFIVPKIAL